MRDIRQSGLEYDAVSVAVNPAKSLCCGGKLRRRNRIGQPKFGPEPAGRGPGRHYSKHDFGEKSAETIQARPRIGAGLGFGSNPV
jgi:hypothetical protein